MYEKTIETRPGFRGRLLKVDVLEVELPSGLRSTREIIRHPGAAVVLAQLDDGRFVFVRQYRKAIERETLEVVAGTLHAGEDPEVCAHRELAEESGYAARELIRLGATVPAPGYTDERLHIYLARLNPAQGALNPDADELVSVAYLTAAEVEAQIASGGIEDAKTMAAWLLYRLRITGGAARDLMAHRRERNMDTKPTLRSRLAGLFRFLTEDIWDIEISALSVRRRFGVSAVRVVQLVWRDFRDDECPLHAAALTFSTMMSIVPVLALSLALARGLGGEDAAKKWVREGVAEWTGGFGGQPAVTAPANPLSPDGVVALPAAAPGVSGDAEDAVDPAALARQINRLVESGFEKMENISFGALGGVGLAVLVWMVIAVLGRVEASFNRVWGVTTERRLLRKFTDYLSVLFILPLLLIAASSLPMVDFATRYLDPATAGVVRDILGSGLLKHLTVFALTTLAFTFLIMFMPNTAVRPLPGLTGGLTAAICFLAWLWVCAALQVGALQAGKIYGSFATLPILLAWVNVSWQIVFLGAEVAFAAQNCNTYRLEHGAYNPSARSRMIVALSVVVDAARAMLTDGKPFRVSTYAQERRIPVRLLRGTMDELTKAGIVAEVANAPGSYALLRAPETLPVKDVIDCVLQSGVNPGGLGLGRVPDAVIQTIDASAKGMAGALNNQTVRDVVGKL